MNVPHVLFNVWEITQNRPREQDFDVWRTSAEVKEGSARLTVDKKLFSPPEGGRIALSVNERIAESLNLAIQAKFAYVNKLMRVQPAFLI